MNLPGFFSEMRAVAIIWILCYSFPVIAQNKAEPDSLRLYKKVESVAKKKKVSYWLYKEIFNLPDEKKKKEKNRKKVNYQHLGGRIIRNIHVTTMDPFGYSVQDTTRKPVSFVQKTLNVLHQKSTRRSILNQLLYKSGDTLDPLTVKESERILRESSAVREISTTVVPVKGTDSVDVYIREQDYWTKTFGIAYSSTRYLFNFSDKNFLGLGHYWSNNFSYYPLERKYVASGTYSVPYISHNLIVPTVYYSSDPDNFFRGVSVVRTFASSLIKWAGSAQVYDIKSSGSDITSEGVVTNYATRSFIRDFWLGRSFRLSEDTMEEMRVTRLIIGARYNMTTFSYHAPEEISPMHFFEDTKFILANIGLSNRSYYRDYYIYRFGVQEDVPIGRLFNIVNGYEIRPSGNRWYAGVEAGGGNHYDDFGYLTMRASFGTFIRQGELEQSVLNLHMGYFSDLLEINQTRVRQFVKLGLTNGFNRIRTESLHLDGDIRGFQSNTLEGIKKATLSLQTQLYLPFNIIGFRFAPFFFLGFGLIAEDNRTLLHSKLYQGYGIGLIIKNELLVINNFQFAIGFYPFMPDNNSSLVKFNPTKTYDFAFEQFDIQAPGVLPLQ